MSPFIFEPASGSGLTAGQHDNLDTLVHDLAETSFKEALYSGNNMTSFKGSATSSKILKIRQSTFTYAANKLDTATKIQYNGAGAAVQTLVSTFTYSGNQLSSIDVVRS